MPLFHGEKMALSLASPMVANLAVVKANNSQKLVRYLPRSILVIDSVCGGDIEHFDPQQYAARGRAAYVVNCPRKLA
jgi:hypothetical protein